MKTAVISDIHGNLQALQKVLDDIDSRGVSKVVSLGDNIGYGPQPEEVISLLRQKNILSIYGNHEASLWDHRNYTKMNEAARISIDITRNLLSESSMAWIKSLKRTYEYGNELYVHGRPPDSYTEYFMYLSPGEMRELFTGLPFGIAFCGHTHLLKTVEFEGKMLTMKDSSKGILQLMPGRRYIVNVGSVGQPRDGNNNAKYVISCAREMKLEIRYVPYPIEITAGLLREKGFPEVNAKRLF